MSIINDLKMEYRVGGIVQRLIFWNVGMFAIPLILFSILKLGGVDVTAFDWTDAYPGDWFCLSSNLADLLWKPWSIIGYAFLHAGILHLVFNMLVLFSSGRLFLTFFTQKQLFGLYILSAIFAGLVFILGYNVIPTLTGTWAGMVGASASIMAILVATATYSPQYPVRLMLIGTVKLWQIAIVLIVLDLINASVENTGGHLAHLAGSLFGFLYIKLLQNGTDLSKGVSAIIDFFANLFTPKKKAPFKKVHRNPAPAAKVNVSKPKDITQKQIDEILDKISKSGYDSLTKDEKDFLFKVGK
ncbi:rhomboid family intramembrane serine protease [Flavobacterium subsaxonicum]|uniref:Transmembrane rhomboid family protein n=1 Tax=Flavobacterium subsaxonicum WB 4.1-42 = DSM 21790 TaxID=1121898 RepID=A0A0A2MS10_9FLAO|nr:rhomboid family intramembrane serine protease [Flavobacterium subsaxonicum]KGO94381.1 transmembrane rhomboid family protein [Flavobacterium subsaxonicum WB 4.1-42 = DSM 21790]